MSKGNELLTTGEVAERMAVTPTTVQRWVKAGKLAAIRTPGGSLRFRAVDIDTILEPEPVAS